MNRTDRLVAMVLYLQGRRVVRAEDLAAHFEVNVRTVYRDMAALGEAGVPISAEAGVGYSLVKSYHLPPVMFSSEEALALFLGGEMVKHFGDASLSSPITTAMLKLRAVLPRDFQDEVGRLCETTAMEASPQGPEGINRQRLLPVQQAIVSRRVLKLDYRGREDAQARSRCVEPLGVTYYADAWYLIAWCRWRKDYRQFKLNRIVSLVMLDERFSPRPEFVLKDYLARAMTIEERLPVRVWFDRRVIDRARRESMIGFQQEHVVGEGTEVEFRTFSYEWIARWLLSFGARVRVLAPPALQAEVRKLADEVIALYAEKDVPADVS